MPNCAVIRFCALCRHCRAHGTEETNVFHVLSFDDVCLTLATIEPPLCVGVGIEMSGNWGEADKELDIFHKIPNNLRSYAKF